MRTVVALFYAALLSSGALCQDLEVIEYERRGYQLVEPRELTTCQGWFHSFHNHQRRGALPPSLALRLRAE